MRQGHVVKVMEGSGLSRILVSSQALLKNKKAEALSLLWMVEAKNEPDSAKSEHAETTKQKQLQQMLEKYRSQFSDPQNSNKVPVGLPLR